MVEDEGMPLTTGQDRTLTFELTHPAVFPDAMCPCRALVRLDISGGAWRGVEFTGRDDEFTGKGGEFTGRNVSTY
eukprot:991036-Prorocentrum_minimum.AAC.1